MRGRARSPTGHGAEALTPCVPRPRCLPGKGGGRPHPPTRRVGPDSVPSPAASPDVPVRLQNPGHSAGGVGLPAHRDTAHRRWSDHGFNGCKLRGFPVQFPQLCGLRAFPPVCPHGPCASSLGPGPRFTSVPPLPLGTTVCARAHVSAHVCVRVSKAQQSPPAQGGPASSTRPVPRGSGSVPVHPGREGAQADTQACTRLTHTH